jgi:hypothetical protein
MDQLKKFYRIYHDAPWKIEVSLTKSKKKRGYCLQKLNEECLINLNSFINYIYNSLRV